MLKKLLSQLFNKLENEIGNDKKSKNGNAIYFVEEILEKIYKKPSYISSKAIKGYYDKYVEEKENNSGEPSTELKNLISLYLEYESFLDFERKNQDKTDTHFISDLGNKIGLRRLLILTFSLAFLIIIIYGMSIIEEDCLIWKRDHYERIDCKDEGAILMLEGINIDTFKKIEINESTIFFKKNKPIVWYGKSINGEMEYFNSRGIHPVTGKELKPITEYMISKYAKPKVD